MRVFQAVRIEGGLFAPDLFDQMLAENLPGQKPQDFGLDGRRGLTDEIAAVFADATDIWRVFKHRIENLEETDPGTSVTRDAWVIPFLGLIGYELYYNRRAHTIDGLTFAISHRAGEHDDAPPVHIVGVNQDLGRVASSGRPRLAPHTLLQEFLNRTDALWGITTNGRVLRLLRDSTYIRRQCYVEFDLEAIFEQRLFQDFVILYRLIHRTRLPKAGADAHHCFLERYYQNSVEQGGRVRDKLRDGVEECIKRLANGFLAHPKNDDLRKRITNRADDRRITPEDLYRQLLRLVYRFLFLMVSEDRGLISSNPLYLNHYSITRLRRLVDDRSAYTGHHDLWISFRLLWRLLSEDSRFPQIGNRPPAELLDLPVLDGDLFDPIYLDECHITNRDLLSALWYLINYQDSPSSPPRRVNYAALDVEELGSVYESLLDYHPWINTSGTPSFDLRPGSERKSTGSYYTPAELVGELVRSALNPVVEDRLKDDSTREDQERALLSIRVVDPACGSGHFLLAAARHLGKMLARIRTGAGEPSPEEVRSATRDVITHCIYGVDKNPLAVELCRVALWIEGYTPGKPLTFLDHRIRCGDSLVGVIDLNVLKSGIPDEAFAPVSGEDRKRASALKIQNKKERLNRQLTDFDLKPDIDRILAESRALARIQDKSLQDIEDKKKRYELQQKAGGRLRAACDLWVAAFFQWYEQSKPGGITTAALRGCLRSGDACPEMGLARTLARNNRFFHWPLEFPEVFEQGGFDVVLGNPPWERIKLQEQEFFATRDPEIANAPNAAARKRLIKRLAETKPELWKEYLDTLHNAESTSRFLRGSGLYPLTGRGDINTYSVFAERMRRLLRDGGRAGIIVPSGIATDDTNKQFFVDLIEKGHLNRLLMFNNKVYFKKVGLNLFALLALDTSGLSDSFTVAVDLADVKDVVQPYRLMVFREADISRINPNTRTLPIFRTRQDAEITRAIYERVPVLVNEKTGENPWGVRFLRMFDMANDSHLFCTRELLEAKGFEHRGNRFVRGDKVYLPLYEAKMIWHYDHCYGTYEGVQDRSNTHLPTPGEGEHADAAFLAQPWYWVAEEEVQRKLGGWEKGWLMGWRNVTNATNERTAIFSMLPRVGVGHSMPLMLTRPGNQYLVSCLLANVTAITFDYFVRQKLGGLNMTFGYIEQFPILPPSAYTSEDLRFILPRVLELTYTSWDIKPFADDVWRDADDELRAAIRLQWDENAQETGGHRWDPPEWIDAYQEIETDPEKGIPLPPFKWDEDRRARLKAELDAFYARLYGLTRKQLRYILDPADLTESELENILDPWEEVDDPLDQQGYEERAASSSFPGETFRVLKEKEIRKYGEYHTRRLVLEAWERLMEKEDA
mgnify:CR=1 FL=1